MSDVNLAEFQKLASVVYNLQRDMALVDVLVQRIDTTIEKLTEVSTTVSQLLAVQGNRLEMQEKLQDKLQDITEKRKVETDEAIYKVYLRIEQTERDLHKQVKDSNRAILDEIKELRNEVVTNGTAAALASSKLQELSNNEQTYHTDFSSRLVRVERWLWTIGGGSVIIGFLLAVLFDNIAPIVQAIIQ